MNVENLFDPVPTDLPAELLAEVLRTDTFRLEKIVSQAHASPPGFWYDQDQREWVILLQGSAGLRFEDDPTVVELKPGCYLDIPAHKRHRVEWTDPNQPTVWLALHY